MKVKYILLFPIILFILLVSKVYAIHCDYYITSLPYTINQSGVYCITQNITYNNDWDAIDINTSNVVINCLGHIINITVMYYDFDVIYSDGNNNITIENCKIAVNNYSFTYIEIDSGSNISIINVTGFGDVDIGIDNCSNVLIKNFLSPDGCVDVGYFDNNVTINKIDALDLWICTSNNIIANNLFLFFCDAFNSRNVTIINATIFRLFSADAITFSNEVNLINAKITNPGDFCVQISSADEIFEDEVKIINSTIYNCSDGIRIDGSNSKLILNNSKIYDVRTGINVSYNISNVTITIIGTNITNTYSGLEIKPNITNVSLYVYNSRICNNSVDINVLGNPELFIYDSFFDTVYPNTSVIANYPDNNYYCNGTPRFTTNVTQNITIPSCPQHLNESNYVCVINTSGTYYIEKNLTNVTIYVTTSNVTIDGKYHKAELNITLNVTTYLTIANLTLENSSIVDIPYSSTLILKNVTIINSIINVWKIIILTPTNITGSSITSQIYGNNNTIYINNSNISGKIDNASIVLYNTTADIQVNNSVVVAKDSNVSISGENSKMNLTDSRISISDNRNCYIYANYDNATKLTVGENSTLEMYNSAINPSSLSISNNSYAIWFENITDQQGHHLDLYTHINVTNDLPFTADCYISSLRLNKHYRFYIPPYGHLDVKFYGPFILVCQIGRYIFTLPVNKITYNTTTSHPISPLNISGVASLPKGKIIVCINNGNLYYNGSLVVNATTGSKKFKYECYEIENPEINKTYTFSFQIENGWIFDKITYGASIRYSLVAGGYNVRYITSGNNGTVNVTVYNPALTVYVDIKALPLYHNYLICVYGDNGEIIINGTPYKFEEPYGPSLKCINISPGIYNITIPKVYYDSKGNGNIFFGIKYFNGTGLYPFLAGDAIVKTSLVLDLPYFNATKPRIGLIAYFMYVPVEFVVGGFGEIDNLAYNKITPKGIFRKTTTISILSLNDIENYSIRAYFPTPFIRDVRIYAYALGYPGLVDYGHNAPFLKITEININTTLPQSGYFILEKLLPKEGDIVHIMDIPEKYFVSLGTYNITHTITKHFYAHYYVGIEPERICLHVFAYLVKTINNTTELESPLKEVYVIHCITWNTSEYVVRAILYDFAPLLNNESYIIANIYYFNKSSNSIEMKNITIPLAVTTIYVTSEKLRDASTVIQSPYLRTFSLSHLGLYLPENPIIYVYYHINVTGEGDYLQQMKQLNLSLPLLVSERYDSVYPLVLKPSLLKNGTIITEVKKFDVKITKRDLEQTIYVKINYSLPNDPIIDFIPVAQLLTGKVLPFRNTNPTTISIAYFYPQQYIVPTLTFEIVILKTNGDIKKFVCTYHNVNLSKGSMTIDLDTDPHCSERSINVTTIINTTSMLFGKLILVLETLNNKLLNGYVTIDNKKYYVRGIIPIITYGITNIQVPEKIDKYKFVKWYFGSLKVIRYSKDPYAIVDVPAGSFIVIAYYNASVSPRPTPHIVPTISLLLPTIIIFFLLGWILLFIGILLIIAGIILIRHGMKK